MYTNGSYNLHSHYKLFNKINEVGWLSKVDSYSASQRILVLWNLNTDYHVHRSLCHVVWCFGGTCCLHFQG